MDRILNAALVALYGIGTVIGALAVAAIVFGFAYAQQLLIWDWTISLGPNFYVAGGMAIFAFFVTLYAEFFGPADWGR